MQAFSFDCSKCGAASHRVSLKKPRVCDECKAANKRALEAKRWKASIPPIVEVAPGFRRCLTCEKDLHLGSYRFSKGIYGRRCIPCNNAKKAERRKTEDRTAEYASRDARRAADPNKKAARSQDALRRRRRRAAYARIDRRHRKRQIELARSRKPWLAAGLTGAEKFRIRYAVDPEFRVGQLLRASLRRKRRGREYVIARVMRRSMKYGSDASAIETLLGYTSSDLKHHLERRFTDGMNWTAFCAGSIHIDHIRPVSSFDLTTDEAIRECWSLANLQPLWAEDNMAKGAKWVGTAANDNDVRVSLAA